MSKLIPNHCDSCGPLRAGDLISLTGNAPRGARGLYVFLGVCLSDSPDSAVYIKLLGDNKITSLILMRLNDVNAIYHWVDLTIAHIQNLITTGVIKFYEPDQK